MNLFGPVARAVAVAGVLVAAGAMPAFAGPAEMALLESYIGTWNGKGTMKAAQDETVVCKMSLSKGNGTKLNYTAAARWPARSSRSPAPSPMSMPTGATRR